VRSVRLRLGPGNDQHDDDHDHGDDLDRSVEHGEPVRHVPCDRDGHDHQHDDEHEHNDDNGGDVDGSVEYAAPAELM
jgi:hypothetical protein